VLDSGRTTDLISENQLTGQNQICILIDGTIRKTPVAQVELETPYFRGPVLAVCMKNPLYDVIVGNIADAENFDVSLSKSNGFETQPEGVRSSETDVTQQINAVTTRSQAKKTHIDKSLKVAKDIDLEITKERLIKLEKKDESLRATWNESEAHDSSPYKVVKGLSYKEMQNKSGDTHRKIVVPTALRNKILQMSHNTIMSEHQGI